MELLHAKRVLPISLRIQMVNAGVPTLIIHVKLLLLVNVMAPQFLLIIVMLYLVILILL